MDIFLSFVKLKQKQVALYNPIIKTVRRSRILPWLPLQWRHNERGGVPNHQPHDCLLNPVYSGVDQRKHLKLRVTGLSPVIGEMASNAKNVSIWWRYHESNATAIVL